MGYVPPHLRGGSGSGATAGSGASAGAGAGSGAGEAPPASTSHRGGDGWGSRDGYRDGGRDGGSSSFYGQAQPFQRSAPRAASGLPETVWFNWQPSERVLALTPDNIKDIRTRLSVTVSVPVGQPEAAPPIESFKEMVSAQGG
jgi:ATP-dependent RNA helicase DDX5/DBP2